MERQREHGTTYETGGYGQQAMETGTEQPSLPERASVMVTGKTPEQQRYESEYRSETGTGTGGRSLADSMRDTLSSRGGLGTKTYQEQKPPTLGEKMKGTITGRTAQEQQAYEHGRGYEQSRERGSGYGTQQQPTIMERVESTFTGRTAQGQHEHNIEQRREREMERSRGGSHEPGLMHSLGSMVSGATSGRFGGTEIGPKKTFGQKMKESMHEIRTSLTGKTPGETTYTPMERTSYGTSYPPSQRHTGRGY